MMAGSRGRTLIIIIGFLAILICCGLVAYLLIFQAAQPQSAPGQYPLVDRPATIEAINLGMTIKSHEVTAESLEVTVTALILTQEASGSGQDPLATRLTPIARHRQTAQALSATSTEASFTISATPAAPSEEEGQRLDSSTLVIVAFVIAAVITVAVAALKLRR